MPILYIAIGRRLGYRLYLAQAREHYFVRWEEPGSERFNIEATTLGFTPRDDEHFWFIRLKRTWFDGCRGF